MNREEVAELVDGYLKGHPKFKELVNDDNVAHCRDIAQSHQRQAIYAAEALGVWPPLMAFILMESSFKVAFATSVASNQDWDRARNAIQGYAKLTINEIFNAMAEKDNET